MKVAGIVKESFVDGDGVRFVVFLQGCPHHCEGCHNKATWDFDGGTEMSVDSVLASVEAHHASFYEGITLSGGEPYMQQEACIALVKRIKSLWKHWNVWCYTGYTYEEVKDEPLTKYVDVLVDGRFEIEKRDLLLRFRGSTNQRLLYLYDGRVWKVE